MAGRWALVGASVLVLLTGCGLVANPGAETSEQREVGESVTAVELDTSGRLVVEVGGSPGLTVTAGENVLEHLTSEVDGDTLVLGTDGSRGRFGNIRYELVVSDLTRVAVRGSGGAEADGVGTDALELEVSGSGDVDLTGLDAQTLGVGISGSGAVRADGRVERQEIVISGSGGYDGANLASTEADVQVSGSGEARVDVSDRLDATVSGSGDVVYTGDPQVRATTTGSGDVRAG